MVAFFRCFLHQGSIFLATTLIIAAGSLALAQGDTRALNAAYYALASTIQSMRPVSGLMP